MKLKDILFVLTLLWVGCTKDTPEPEKEIPEKISPPEKPQSADTSKKLQFIGYDVLDFKVYAGSAKGGMDITPTIVDPSHFFVGSFTGESIIERLKHDSLVVTKDSIFEHPVRSEANRFTYKVTSKDSLFRWNIYSSAWEWYGYQKSAGQQINYLKSLYRFSKVSSQTALYLSGTLNGRLSNTDFFNDNPYRFKDLLAMTAEQDTVAFCVVQYRYEYEAPEP